MSRVGAFILGILVGAVGLQVGQSYHFVRASDGVHMVPKLTSGFTETYVDIREFTADDWQTHQSLAAALMRDGRDDLLADPTLARLRTNVRGVLDSLGITPQPR